MYKPPHGEWLLELPEHAQLQILENLEAYETLNCPEGE